MYNNSGITIQHLSSHLEFVGQVVLMYPEFKETQITSQVIGFIIHRALYVTHIGGYTEQDISF